MQEVRKEGLKRNPIQAPLSIIIRYRGICYDIFKKAKRTESTRVKCIFSSVDGVIEMIFPLR